ncbi:MAG: hypothetical protein ACJ74J_03290 [Blastocatellia bacterium]
MKPSRLPLLLLAAACCFLFASETRAQGVYGYTSLDYDDGSGIVTAYSETDLDYDVWGDYDAYVSLNVVDDYGSVVASGSAKDMYGEGFISLTLQFTGSADVTYTARGLHKAYVNYYDYDYEDFYPYRRYIYYWDTWHFSYFEGQNIYQPWYYYFFSPGYSPFSRRTRYVPLGTTTDYAVLTVRAPHPVNFHLIETNSINDGTLYSKWAWDSSDGNLEHLDQCTVHEYVTHNTRSATFVWPSPPFNSSEPATYEYPIPGISGPRGWLDDNYLPPIGGYVYPYRYSTFTTTQVFRYRCDSINGGRPVTLKGPLRIVRTVQQNGPNGTWTYTCTQGTRSASTNLGGS